MKSTAKEKGNLLEHAVYAIESHIFTIEPSLKEATIYFERNKIISSGGAKYEIDLIARAEFSKYHDVTYIFECKNWKKKVGRKEVTDFSEKIKIINASCGFIIAASFTKDAEARASNDGRIKLLKVDNEINIDSIPFVGLFSPSIEISKIEIKNNLTDNKYLIDDIFELDGGKTTLIEIAKQIGFELQEDLYNLEPELMLTEHTFEKEKEVFFETRKLTHQNLPIQAIKVTFIISITHISPVVKSQFNIEKRGRYCTIEMHDANSKIKLTSSFTQLG